ncbi:hypothetical protein FRB98_000319, partial [Tulasnella sp. 332]
MRKLRGVGDKVSFLLCCKTKSSSNRTDNASQAPGEAARAGRPVDPDDKKASASDSPPNVPTPDSSSATPNRVARERSSQLAIHDGLPGSSGADIDGLTNALPLESTIVKSTAHAEPLRPPTIHTAQRAPSDDPTTIDPGVPDPPTVDNPPAVSIETGKTSIKSISSYLLGGTKISLNTLSAISAVVPVPWLQSVVGAAIQVITVAEAVASNSDAAKDLQERTYGLMIVIITPLQGKSDKDLEDSLRNDLGRLAVELSGIADELRILCADTGFRHLSSFPKAVLTYSDIQGRIAKCSAKLEWAMKVFHLAAADKHSLQVESQIQSRLDDLQRHGQLLDAIRTLENQVGSVARIMKTNLLKQSLVPADAAYNSHSRKAASSCLEGTREGLLEQICNWIYGKQSDQLGMFYLFGLAGTGKSTIAETVAKYCAEGGNLGATFFFARDHSDRRDA